ncbi:polysaccharide biosynthesis protein, partial [bacterium]|nr:polysaccharide biosynthesis protein [bacterium]
GLKLAEHAKKLNQDTIVILMTGYGTPELKEKIKESGVSYYFEKPFNFKGFTKTVQNILSNKNAISSSTTNHLSSRFKRTLIKTIQVFMDVTLFTTAFWLSYLLRFDFHIADSLIPNILHQLPIVLAVQYIALLVLGAYSFIWRYIGFREIKTFAYASGLSFCPLLLLRLFLPSSFPVYKMPISILIMTTIFGFGGVLLLRIIRRGVYERLQKRHLKNQHESEIQEQELAYMTKRKDNVLLIGAGQAGILSVKEIQKHSDLEIRIKGFIDDDLSKLGLVISGVKVIGNTEKLPELIPKLKIDHVIITISRSTSMEIARIVAICEKIPVKVRIIPGLFELLDGKVEVNRIRDVVIEDLLGREKVELNLGVVSSSLSQKCVMITGAGGSIGSELVRQVQKFNPNLILMIERCEYALYLIERELCSDGHNAVCIPIIADINDEDRMNGIFDQYKPDVILHAAAHKHVPLMEANPTEAIKNNSLATWKLADIAGKHNTNVFVLISTDKAVNPTSIMGASKRIAELLIQGLNGFYNTRYLAVRFGNVLGSTGSVIPLFREQIRKGGPVTVTHKDMTRYFMTIPEAAQLVLQASTMGKGAEIFILDMGEPVKIVDLAESMIRLSGLKPHEDILLIYTGLRPGEKLYEELNAQDDFVDKTRHPKIFIVKIKEFESKCVHEVVENLVYVSSNGHEIQLQNYICDLLPESTIATKVEAED